VARADGSELHAAERIGALSDAILLGRDLGEELRGRAADDLFE